MSLFRAREIWSSTIGSSETFDEKCLCTYNINNADSNLQSTDGTACLVIGSHSGMLRVVSPNSEKNENGTFLGFKPEDILLETQLPYPNLQLAVGKFISSSSTEHLAILHPRKLCIYTLTSSVGKAEYATQSQLVLAYEHNLQRNAHSMTTGSFGGVVGRDFFCIQSLDGTLSFFEQESFAFCRFLPKFLLPGPIEYIKRVDSFVTVSSSYQMECYKYQVLAVAADVKTKEESQNIKQGKKVSMDWSYNLGEQAIDIKIINLKSTLSSIVVLGERHLFCVKDTGVPRFIIKLDYSPSAFFPYLTDLSGNIMMMVATHNKTLLVYKESTLQWAAQIPVIPVHVNRISISGIQGAICLLSDEGELTCQYLGTDPSLFTAPVFENVDINYKDTDKELMELYRIIKESNKPISRSKKTLQEQSKDALKIEISLSDDLIPFPDHIPQVNLENDEKVSCVVITVRLKPQKMLSQVRLSIAVDKPLASSQSVSDFNSLGENVEIESYIYLKNPFIPSDLSAKILTVFFTEGKQRMISQSISLPLALVLRPCMPYKDSAHKITVDVNKATPALSQLFPEYGQESSDSSTSAVGVRIFCGHNVGIFSSKSSNRFRIQSDCFEAMYIILKELLRRIYLHLGINSNEINLFKFGGQLPLKECCKLIDEYHQCRLNGLQLQNQLTKSAAQYRAIQKRLLTKFKDKTPSPLTNLDVLLESTHFQTIEAANELEKVELELERVSCALSSCIKTLHELVKLQCNLDDEKFNVFCSALSSNIGSQLDQISWEELTDTAITHLLKANKTNSAVVTLKDTSSLKRHIAQFIEKITSKTLDFNFLENSNEEIGNEPLPAIQESNQVLEDSLKSAINQPSSNTNKDDIE